MTTGFRLHLSHTENILKDEQVRVVRDVYRPFVSVRVYVCLPGVCPLQ